MRVKLGLELVKQEALELLGSRVLNPGREACLQRRSQNPVQQTFSAGHSLCIVPPGDKHSKQMPLLDALRNQAQPSHLVSIVAEGVEG